MLKKADKIMGFHKNSKIFEGKHLKRLFTSSKDHIHIHAISAQDKKNIAD